MFPLRRAHRYLTVAQHFKDSQLKAFHGKAQRFFFKNFLLTPCYGYDARCFNYLIDRVVGCSIDYRGPRITMMQHINSRFHSEEKIKSSRASLTATARSYLRRRSKELFFCKQRKKGPLRSDLKKMQQKYSLTHVVSMITRGKLIRRNDSSN